MTLKYFQYCNIVELHSVQCTSTRFLTIAYSMRKVTIIYPVHTFLRFWLHELYELYFLIIKFIKFKHYKVQANNKIKKFELHNYDPNPDYLSKPGPSKSGSRRALTPRSKGQRLWCLKMKLERTEAESISAAATSSNCEWQYATELRQRRDCAVANGDAA